LWKKADEDEKEFARQELEKLTEKANQGEIELVYFDGSGFNLWAKIVYAWQKRALPRFWCKPSVNLVNKWITVRLKIDAKIV